MTLDYEFLDDMYTIQEWGHQNVIIEEKTPEISTKKTRIWNNHGYEAFNDRGHLTKNAVTYVEDSGVLRHNHPLSIMVSLFMLQFGCGVFGVFGLVLL